MDIKKIEKDFKSKISDKINITSEGKDRFRISTPFVFNDGDHFVVVLKKRNENWIITDEANTFMHLSYDINVNDLEKGEREKVINSTLSMFNINEREGELNITIENDDYGDSLYSFVQGLMKISDIDYLSRERAKSVFFEDFKVFMLGKVPQERLTFNYYDEEHDKNKTYKVDCKINGMPKPLFVFAINSDEKCRESTIVEMTFEKWNVKHKSLAIFEDQEIINRRAVAMLTDVFERQFSSLYANKEKISKFLEDTIIK